MEALKENKEIKGLKETQTIIFIKKIETEEKIGLLLLTKMKETTKIRSANRD